MNTYLECRKRFKKLCTCCVGAASSAENPFCPPKESNYESSRNSDAFKVTTILRARFRKIGVSSKGGDLSDPFIEQPGLSRQEADYSDYVAYSVLHISKRRRNLFRNVSRHPIED